MNEELNLKSQPKTRVLSVYPTYRGFGYVVFEGATNPIDWSTVTISERNNYLSIKKIKSLIKYYQPDVLVTGDYTEHKSRRSSHILSLTESIRKFEKEESLRVKTFTSSDISNVFEPFGAFTKYDRTQVIAKFLPMFEFYKPPKRKPWMSEDSRMAIFDAIALVITYFYLEQ